MWSINDIWWGCLDLNQGPISYEPTALTTELHPRVVVEVDGAILFWLSPKATIYAYTSPLRLTKSLRFVY